MMMEEEEEEEEVISLTAVSFCGRVAVHEILPPSLPLSPSPHSPYTRVCYVCVGLFVDSVVAVARKELAWETDYEREAQFSSKFRYTFLHLVRTESEDNYS